MIKLVRTESTHPDFGTLVMHLDAYLQVRNGEDHSFFAQFNQIDVLQQVVVAYDHGVAVGCGAIKPFAPGTAEVKRMYVLPAFRGRGIAGLVLQEMERWAAELGYENLILETGKDMLDAVRLYGKSGYGVIPNYGQYAHVESSVCMQKDLVPVLQ